MGRLCEAAVLVAALAGCGRLDFGDLAGRGPGGTSGDGGSNDGAPSGDAKRSAPLIAATYPAGSGPDAVTIADFNNDGLLDIAVGNGGSNNITLLLADGTGAFITKTVTTGGSPLALTAHDFDGDGNVDLAVPFADNNTIAMLFGDGAGGFATRAAGVGTAMEPAAVAFGDFNGDGHPDVVTADYNSTQVTVAFGASGGSLTSPATTLNACGEPAGVAVGRFNADAFDDIAVACYTGNEMVVLFGDGTGAFPTTTTISTGAASMPNAIAIADLDGDSHLDVADAGFGNGKCGVAFGDGNGGFGAVQSFTVGQSPLAIAIGDVDHDGNLDIVLADYLSSTTIDVLHGNGTGGFAPFQTVTVGMQPDAIALADLDGDGVGHRRRELAIEQHQRDPRPELGGPQLEQELDVARRAGDRRFDIATGDEAVRARPRPHFVDRAAPRRFIAHDTALAHVVAPDLELRLDQRDDRLAGGRPQQLGDPRQHERERDERHVDHGEPTRFRNLVELEVAHVLAFEHDDARILANRPRELAVADVDRIDLRSAALQQHVGKPAGRRANVESDHATRIDRESVEPFDQLQRAARNVRMIGLEQRELGGRGD